MTTILNFDRIFFKRGSKEKAKKIFLEEGEPCLNMDSYQLNVGDKTHQRGGVPINTLTCRELISSINLNTLTAFGRYYIRSFTHGPLILANVTDVIVEVLSPSEDSNYIYQNMYVLSGEHKGKKFSRYSSTKNKTFDMPWTEDTPGTGSDGGSGGVVDGDYTTPDQVQMMITNSIGGLKEEILEELQFKITTKTINGDITKDTPLKLEPHTYYLIMRTRELAHNYTFTSTSTESFRATLINTSEYYYINIKFGTTVYYMPQNTSIDIFYDAVGKKFYPIMPYAAGSLMEY